MSRDVEFFVNCGSAYSVAKLESEFRNYVIHYAGCENGKYLKKIVQFGRNDQIYF